MRFMLKVAGITQEDIKNLTRALATMFNNKEGVAMSIIEYDDKKVSLEKVLEVDEILEHKTNEINYEDFINKYE